MIKFCYKYDIKDDEEFEMNLEEFLNFNSSDYGEFGGIENTIKNLKRFNSILVDILVSKDILTITDVIELSKNRGRQLKQGEYVEYSFKNDDE